MEEAIAAVATGGGRAAIGVIRLSGAGCIQALGRVFFPKNGAAFPDSPPRAMVYGRLFDRDGRLIDHALAFCCPAPHSYTGEDTAELHCHGSPTLLAMAMDALLAQGVRLAQPGEFTRRAFLNGKLDLTQAEGVADLIDAPSPSAVRAASRQLGGALSQLTNEVYQSLLELAAHFHATVDYPDEDLDPFGREDVEKALENAGQSLAQLLGSYRRGQMIARGIPCALVGRPNVGKSSLLNALLGYDRAIVTQIPGTTRDTLEELCQLGGVALRLTDTAGLRDTDDQVEQLGVERSRRALAECELALAVVDGSQPLTPEDQAVLTLAAQAPRALCLLNKADLPPAFSSEGLTLPALRVSARTGLGLERLEQEVIRLFPQGDEGEVFLSNPRQYAAAMAAQEALGRAREALSAGLPIDLPLLDVEAAMAALGELTGRSVREDVVDQIFSRFCLGK